MFWLGITVALANTQEAAPTPTPAAESEEGLIVSASREGDRVLLTLDVPDGLHVYGPREPSGLPLQVYVANEQIRSKVPRGERVDLGAGLAPSYWLSGIVRIEAKTPANKGELRVQACSENTCYPPTRLAWKISPVN